MINYFPLIILKINELSYLAQEGAISDPGIRPRHIE